MVICVGAVSAGKSFLLSALCDPSFQQDSYIVPTVGVNIFTLNIDSRTCATIRELGGALCAVWSSYIASETKLIFVVDSSDIASIALVATKLTECAALLEENSARENKVGRLCIVWTKLDRSASQGPGVYISIDVILRSPQCNASAVKKSTSLDTSRTQR